jgi:hypothetical protein
VRRADHQPPHSRRFGRRDRRARGSFAQADAQSRSGDPRPAHAAAPAEFLALQVSRLNEALLVSYGAMHTCVSGANFEAIDRVVRIVRELDGQSNARRRADSRSIGQRLARSGACLRKRRNEKGAKSLKTNKPVKTATRNQSYVIENKQSREMTDSAPITISTTYAAPRETFRFAWRNERFRFGRFSASLGREAQRVGQPVLIASAPQSESWRLLRKVAQMRT